MSPGHQPRCCLGPPRDPSPFCTQPSALQRVQTGPSRLVALVGGEARQKPHCQGYKK